MIIQALNQLYYDLLSRGDISPEGWSAVKVGNALCLDADGRLVDVLPTVVDVQDNKGKTKIINQTMMLPAPVKRSSGIVANFLCDGSGYMLGATAGDKPERSKKCFDACKEKHVAILSNVDSPVARAILRFFNTWNPETCRQNEMFALHEAELLGGSNLVFRVEGSYAHEDPAIQAAWQRYYAASEGEVIRCMVSGEEDVLAKIHPAIKGVVGAQSSGAAIVSFNAEAFCSYGHEQGANAPIGNKAAFAYTSALNYLLADRDNVQRIGDISIVSWVQGAEPQYADFLSMTIFGTQPDGMDENTLHRIVKRLADGLPCGEQNLSPDKEFYILGLAPNAARLAVAFFYRSTFGELMRNVNAHHERMQIAGNKYAYVPMWAMLRETVNKKSSDAKPSPIMESAVFRAVLNGLPYPAALLQAVMLRIRAERDITAGRAAILKAYYLKNKDISCPEEVLTVSLNENSTNVPYTLGRLFAVYEAAQRSANPGINATIKDKFFSAAAATPAHIFPRLIDLYNHHLRKLNTGTQVYYEKQAAELMGVLGDAMPETLSLPEQGSFYLGYYHQRQKQFEKKEEK